MKILAIIPARGGSKGVPGKNIKILNGKPLLAYTAEVALASRYLDGILVSTDDAEIKEVAQKYGLDVPFLRPTELAQDHTPTIAVVQHALEFLALAGKKYDAVCLLQPTSPFRTVKFLDEAIQKFKSSDCDALISVRKVPVEYNPHWTFVKDSSGNLVIATGEQQIIPRRQELPDAFHRDGSIYITRTEVIMQNHSLLGRSTAYVESTDENHINIDTLSDWEQASMIAQNLKSQS